MFFEENKMNDDALKCGKCQNELIKPNTICSNCIVMRMNENSSSLNDFPKVKAIENLLTIEAKKRTEHEAIESLKTSMKKIDEQILEYKIGIVNTIEYIKQYGLKLKRNVKLSAINDNNELVMRKIDNFITESENSYEPINDDSKKVLQKIQQKLENYHAKCLEYLKNDNNQNLNFF